MRSRFVLGSAILLLCAPVLAQDAPARKKAAKRDFRHLVPEDAAVTLYVSGLHQLRGKLRRLERAVPWLLRGAGERGPRFRRRLGRYLRGEELPPGVDDRRPIGFAMDLSGDQHAFIPVKDAEAFRNWIGDAPVHASESYAVVTRRGEYRSPAKATPGPAARGDVVLSLRPGALLERFRPQVEAGIAAMEAALASEPDLARVLPPLRTEIGLLLKLVESTEQFDMGVSIGGQSLNLQFHARPTKEGFLREVIAAMKKSDTMPAGGLGGLIPAGGLLEMEARVPPAVIHPILDAVPWKKIWPEETEARRKLWSEFLDLSTRYYDGRAAVSYSFHPRETSFEIYEVIGVTDGDAYRKFFREAPRMPIFKEMVNSIREFLPDFKIEIRPDAFRVAGVAVDFFREELNALPGLPYGGDSGEGKLIKLDGYFAVVDNAALIAVGSDAKPMIERMIYLTKAGGVFQNMLTARGNAKGFARASLDIGALARTIRPFVPEELSGRLARLEMGPGELTVSIEKTLRRNSAMASVDVPLMRILRAVVGETKAPSKKAKKVKKSKKKRSASF